MRKKIIKEIYFVLLSKCMNSSFFFLYRDGEYGNKENVFIYLTKGKSRKKSINDITAHSFRYFPLSLSFNFFFFSFSIYPAHHLDHYHSCKRILMEIRAMTNYFNL